MLAKFMVVAHYTYLVLKMPALIGVLSIYGDLTVSFKCDSEALDIVVMRHFRGLGLQGHKGRSERPDHPRVATHRHHPGRPSTKRVRHGLPDPEKMVVIGDNLGRNRNSHSPVSSRIMRTYSHGGHRYVRCPQGASLALLGCKQDDQAYQVEAAPLYEGSQGGH
jgi:hypothetical protein